MDAVGGYLSHCLGHHFGHDELICYSMSWFREIPPTAGFPLDWKRALSIFKTGHFQDTLESDFRDYLDVEYAKVTCSGTAALYLILETLKKLSPRKMVIIPSFICPLVPLAIKRAGLNVEICDINKGDFNFNLLELEELCLKNPDILAIVPVHLGGIPLDLDPIKKISEQYGIFLIEDCAQSLGATYQDKKVGTMGDFSFFSLCRGKGLTIYEGGVIVTSKKDYVGQVEETIERLVKDDFVLEWLRIFELFGYGLFYRPLLFWFVFKLPQMFWNLQGKRFRAFMEYFTAEFPIHHVSKMRKQMGHVHFHHLEEEIKRQREKASYYIEGLRGVEGVQVVKAPEYGRGNYPYLTLIFDTPVKREMVLKRFENSGLGISQIYACPITDYDYLKPILPDRSCPNAHYLAEREITLSTSTFLKEIDLDSILNILRDLLGGNRRR
jgi:perosamine synthetase